MRILQVFNRYLERGGEEVSVERISDSLGMRHEIFHCYFDSRQLGTPRGFLEMADTATTMVWNRTSALRLKNHALAVKPDVILFHNIFPVGTASLLQTAFKLGVPTIAYIHNFRPYSVNGYLWAGNKIVPQGLRRNFLPEILAGAWQGSRAKTALYASVLLGMHAAGMFRRIGIWVAISHFMRDTFIKAGVPSEKITTLLHSSNPQANPPAPRDGGYYLYLGRLIPAKGLETLLATWTHLKSKLGSKCPRLIIAGDGPMAVEIARRVASDPWIEYVGHVSGQTKQNLIGACRAMIAPSLWWEPLGLVTYEAYDYSKPMLAAASGGLTETVQHGVTGLLHQPGNAGELAQQIMVLDANEPTRASMGRKGREWLLVKTNKQRWLDDFDQILLRATQSRKKSRLS